MTLLAFAADRRAAVDMDRKAAAPAADAPCSNRLQQRGRQHQTRRTLLHESIDGTDGQTDRNHRPTAS